MVYPGITRVPDGIPVDYLLEVEDNLFYFIIVIIVIMLLLFF